MLFRSNDTATTEIYTVSYTLSLHDALPILNPKILASKAKAFLLEVVGNSQIDEIKLEVEHNLLGSLQVYKIQLGSIMLVIKPFWQVRISKREFSEWWQMKNKVSIFFDGASKGNPGKAGAGGLIFYPSKRLETNFNWGVGHITNNQA